MTKPKATGTRRQAASESARPAGRPAASTRARAAAPKRTAAEAAPKTATEAAATTEPANAEPEARTAAAKRAEAPTPSGLELYLLRHADAGDPAKWTGDDAARPLSAKGRRQAKRLGRLLKDLDADPDVVLTSPKVRASETARLVARSIGSHPSTDERLSVDFGSRELAEIVSGLEANVRGVLLVGHDPDFSTVLSWLVGSDIEMRKGALARIDLPDWEVGPGRGSLRWLLPPDAVAG